MIKPINNAILNIRQAGHLVIRCNSNDDGLLYARTLNSARCFDMAFLAGISSSFISGIMLFKMAVVWWITKVEHFNYVPHPIEYFGKKIALILKITPYEFIDAIVARLNIPLTREHYGLGWDL